MIAWGDAARSQVVAREAGVIAILRSEGDSQLITRIRAELDASGFAVVEIEPEPRPDRNAPSRTLAELAAEHSADAALRVRTGPNRVELWTASAPGEASSEAPSEAQGTLDTITVRGAEAHLDEVLALRVVETLRARGLGVMHTRKPPPSPIAKPAAAPQEATTAPSKERADDDEHSPPSTAPSSSRSEARAPEPVSVRAPQLWIEIAPTISLSPGGLAPELEAWLSARLQLARFVSIAAFASIPLWREEIDSAEGSASIATWLVGAAVDAHVRVSPFELSAGAGIASVIAQMSGTASAPLEGTEETVLAVAPLVRAALHFAWTPGFRLFAHAQLGVSLPAISMRFTEASDFTERHVASWGEPFAMLGLGVEIGLLDRAFSD